MSSADTIDDYLDELAEQLTNSGEKARRFLTEVESHLRDESDARIAKGIDLTAAEAAAIRSFGTTAQIARAENRNNWYSSRSAVAVASVELLLRLVALGMLVVGVAGAAAFLISKFGLVTAMYGLPANVLMPAASCAHWLAVESTATTCQQAGTLEASSDLPIVYFAIGFLGLLITVPLFVVWLRRRAARRVLPTALGPAISSAMFGAMAIGLLSLGIANAVISTAWGKGMWLTDAAAALIACAMSLLVLVRSIRNSYTSPSTRSYQTS